jgi:hypothetical protein
VAAKSRGLEAKEAAVPEAEGLEAQEAAVPEVAVTDVRRVKDRRWWSFPV